MMMMMRCGALDVDPFLISRNTLGNGKTTTQNLKDKCQMVVAAMPWWLRKWNDGLCYAEVVVVVDEEAMVPK